MERMTLKGGQWIDVRSKEEVTVRGRRALQSISLGLKDFLLGADISSGTKFEDLDVTEDQADAMLRLQEATVVALVAGWSLPGAVTLSSVADLPGGLFDEIAALVAPIGAELASLDTRATLEPDPKDLSGSLEPSGGL